MMKKWGFVGLIFGSYVDGLILFPIACLFSIISGTFIPSGALFLGKTLDLLQSLQDNKPLPSWFPSDWSFVTWVLLVVSTVFFLWFSSAISELIWRYISLKAASNARSSFMTCLLQKDLSWWAQTQAFSPVADSDAKDSQDSSNSEKDRPKDDGKINAVHAVTVQCDSLEDAVRGLGTLIHGFSAFVTGTFISFWIYALLTLSILGCIPVLAIVSAFWMWMTTELGKSGAKSLAMADTVSGNLLKEIKFVRSFPFHCAQQLTTEMSQMLSASRKAEGRKTLANAALIGITLGLTYLAAAVALRVGASLSMPSEDEEYDMESAGDVLACVFALLIGAFMLGTIGPAWSSIAAAKLTINALSSITGSEPVRRANLPKKPLKPPRKSRYAVEFQNVTFTYPKPPSRDGDDEEIPAAVRNLSFSVKPGLMVGIVGSSGSGKSTILSLISGLYPPTKGSIAFSGKTVGPSDADNSIEPCQVRETCKLVTQDAILFSGTIEENIRLGDVNHATTEDCEIAASMVGDLHAFVTDSLEDGYHTNVGEMGARLSGGQRQKICLARALVNHTTLKCLLLDEFTASLDSASEVELMKVLLDLKKQLPSLTIFIVAHRLSTVKDADQIWVMSEGRLVEKGNHIKLMKKKGGAYRSLQKASRRETELSEDKSEATQKTHKQPQMMFDEKSQDPEVDSTQVTPTGTPFSRKHLWELLRLARPEWYLIGSGTFISVVMGLEPAVFAVLFALLLSAFSEPSADEMLEKAKEMFWAFLIFSGAIIFLYFFQGALLGWAGVKVAIRLRINMFSSMLRKKISWFDMKDHHSASLVKQLSEAPAVIQKLVTEQIGFMTQNFFAILFGLGVAFFFGWIITLVVLAAFPFLALTQAMALKLIAGFDRSKSLDPALVLLKESVGDPRGLLLSKAYNLEDHLEIRFKDEIHQFERRSRKIMWISALSSGLPTSVLFASLAIDFWIGAIQIENGTLSITDLLIVLFSIMTTSMVAGYLFGFSANIPKASRIAAKVFEEQNREIESEEAGGEKRKLKANKGPRVLVKVQNVSFAYPSAPSVKIFQGLNFLIKSGQIVAFVGTSGAGKSTLMQLLLRFYHPNQGSIFWKGKPKETNDFIRKRIAWVPQQPVLFEGKIEDALRFGLSAKATMEDVEKACRVAQAHHFITNNLPQGYSSRIGADGCTLSRGQQQRICIARAFLRASLESEIELLCFDEATSALSAKDELKVQKSLSNAIKELQKSRPKLAILLIAHRVSSIQHADKIFLIQNGVIAEEGNHADLVNDKTGLYFTLMKRQL